ncbi:E3 ubiquitin-protein ligase tom1 [Knufia obscura]|uniref:HECT-type E3 ubiquitin transferase n=2 Tax=Knufia TaxID=430999 RepID=A0AAN8ELX9_9EURO|nr:E3 ubiquitin-protein ligase tom1 [Knufia obscura]KAK5958629.1 E3 ubiquitin-protein ligase tom1 [Knufia fluminis]
MGKVQKKANDKHKLSLSPALSEFIAKTTSLPLAQLPRHLKTFPSRWPFPRGDLYNWIETLDRFDEVLQKFNKTYGLDDGPQTKPFGTTVLDEGDEGADAALLQEVGFGADGDIQLIQSILAFSRLLLEKCGNRTLYNSSERLNDLLNTTSLPLLQETLRLTLVLAQRFADRGPQAPGHAHFYQYDISKLQKLASPIPRTASRKAPQSPVKTPKLKDKASQPKLRRAPTTADPNDFRALARQSQSMTTLENSTTDGGSSELDWTASAAVRVVWSSQASVSASRPTASRTTTIETPSSPTPLRRQQSAGAAAATPSVEIAASHGSSADQSGVQQIELGPSDLATTTIEAVLQNAPESMPATTRYELLHKLRISYGLVTSPATRNMLLEIRLAALGVVAQVFNEEELTSKYFDGDSSASARQRLVQQLVDLLRDPTKSQNVASLYVQSLAMEALAVLSRFRQMSSEINSALSPNSSHGLLIQLVNRGLADIAQDGDATDNDSGDDWRHAVFMMWTIFMSQSGPHNTRSTEQYVHKNLISAYASGLQVVTGKSLRVHYYILKFLESLFHHFKDGLQILNSNGAFGIACDTTHRLSKQSLELHGTGQGFPEEWRTPGVDFKIPYQQQFVLRELLSLVKDISKHQGNHADRALRGFVDSSNLLQAFRLILSHMDEFGAHTWSEVVTAVCGFLNNEPTSYTVVSEAGIVATLLDTVQPQSPSSTDSDERPLKTVSAVPSKLSLKLPPIADAITNIATAFGAICLTEAGHAHFVKSNVIEKFFELFESPEHVKAIRDTNTQIQLGSTFDELVRHHPGLKNIVLSSLITMLARVRYICTSTLRQNGAGPKIWVESPSGSTVEGGVEALMVDLLPSRERGVADIAPIELPNKDTLEFETSIAMPEDSVALAASDEDAHELNALDYARPVAGFLSTFLENHFLCKEFINAGALDLVLDFVSLPTIPVVEDSFSDGAFMQDLTSAVRTLCEDKPFLVLPVLIDRARHICSSSLAEFTDHQPDNVQCYFGHYLQSENKTSTMEVDRPQAPSSVHGTKLVKALMNVYSITRVLAELFTAPTYHARGAHSNIIAQLNISDILSELITLYGRLSAACCREEISLLASMSKTWLDETRPGNYSTGDSDVDVILDVSNGNITKLASNDEQNQGDSEESVEEVQDTAAFRNLKTLRYLLTETPAAISTLFSRVGSSFGGKRKAETIVRQKAAMVSEALAGALTTQLNPPFMSKPFLTRGDGNIRDWRFKYLTVALSRVRDSLWEDNNGVSPSNHIRQSFVVDCFRRADGMQILTNIGAKFFEELKKCQVDGPVFAANAGLKICLDLFDQLTNNELIQSQQTTYMKYTELDKPFYFNPNQLLLELRMESMHLTRNIWDSEYAEQASDEVVRKLASILKHTLKGENEDGALARAEDYPKLKAHGKRKFDLDKSRVTTLTDKGFDQALAEEALYRCNVIHPSQVQSAELYCRTVRDNNRRRRLPIPEDDVRYKGDAPSSQVTSPPSAMEIVTGPTATIFEDSSQDGDVADALDIVGNNVPAETPNTSGPVDASRTQSPRTQPTSSSAMNISNILNDPQPPTPTLPAAPCYTRQTIDAERESIRDQLAERCNNILSSHATLIFDLNDLLSAGAVKLNDEMARSWWEAATNLLVMSLLSQNVDAQMDEARGKKIAAAAHLLGLLCSNDTFKPSMLKVLQTSIDGIIDFLQVPVQKPVGEESYPWIAPTLLILEKMLALDAEPDEVTFNVPNDLDSYTEPKLTHNTVVEHPSKVHLFERLMEIMPKVGKDHSMALSVIRTLVILTRDRKLAVLQGERRNLQKLFLMVKQLGGGVNARLEGTFMTILRHVIEDDVAVQQIMEAEIVHYFRNRSTGRPLDLTNYLRELSYLALRSPALFVQASNAKLKLNSWSPGQSSANSILALREQEPENQMVPESDANVQDSANGGPAVSVENDSTAKNEDAKSTETKIPVVEHPDGIIHFLLSEMLSYRDVEDSESNTSTDATDGQSDRPGEATLATETNGDESKDATEKAEKPRFKADEHPIFIYRCFLMHCLTELLYSYNQTKIEFISFSRKADPLAATPSKARAGVLNYLLSGLVSSGYVDKDESVTCRKRLATSEWSTRAIVALCTKTGEKDLGSSATSRYSSAQRQVEDNDNESELTYVRRFVLEHAIKAFKDTFSSSEPLQARYGRLLCLADLFHKLISKPQGPEGSVYSNNTSYKRIARMMLEKNLIAVLTSAISDIELSFPSAKRVVKFILRPLKELTATATDLNLNSPDEFPQIVDQTRAAAESISSASSEVSDELVDEREETPDLYRNSALGMLDPARQDESDSDNDDEDEEMDYDEYDEEMDYDDDMAAPVNDGEVVSDEELEDAMEGAGPMEGMPGDVPMDIEFVVDHHHHHHHDPDDDESESSDDDDEDEDSDEDDDEAEDIEIEMEDDDEGGVGQDRSDGAGNDDGDDGWEDEDEEDVDEEDDGEEIDFEEDDLPIPGGDPSTSHLDNLLRVIGHPEDMPPEAGVVLQSNRPEDLDEDDDEDEDGEDLDENDGMDYDQPFDMMLDGPDYDENEEWGWEEPPPPVFRRSRHSRATGGMPPFFSRRLIANDPQHEMMHQMMGTRNYRRAPSGRNAAEDGTNPLLQRPDNTEGNGQTYTPGAFAPFGMAGAGGPGQGLPLMFTGGPGGPSIALPMPGGPRGFGGHGAILDAIVGALQRGDPQMLHDGRLQLNVTAPVGDIQELLRGPSSMPSFMNRQPREDPQRSAQFIPMLTISRWQEEARLLFGKNLVTKSHPIQVWVYASLVPAAQHETKEREKERKRLEEERKEAERKAEEERLNKAEEERVAKEQAEAEERARAEAEAAAAEEHAGAEPQPQPGDAMEGVQSSEETEEPAEELQARRYTTIRGRQLDITGLDIDVEYLEALPEDLREEVITAQYQNRREQAQEQGNDDSAIDQEFLNALPEDIREEIRAQEAAAQRRRERDRARREAQASAPTGQAIQPGDMDVDDFLATLDPAFRRAILAEQPEGILSGLSAQHAAEGRSQARNTFFQHRMPTQRELENGRGRRGLAQRHPKRQQIVQLVDKAGVATLLRLMFLQQQGSLKGNLLSILSQVCGNRQTRYEVVSLLLVILKDGSTDVTAIERSLASLSLRAKASGAPKTPQPLKRTLSMQPYAGLSDDITPMLVVQQCLNTLSHICKHNAHVKSLFLREVDVTSTNKAKTKGKGKSKDAKQTTHPVNDLISLLDRRLIMDNSSCLYSLASLLATVTSPLASLMKQEKEREAAEKKQEEATKAKVEGIEKQDPSDVKDTRSDVTMEDATAGLEPESSGQKSDESEATKEKDEAENVEPAESEKKKQPFEPPSVTDHNLKLITNIFVAPECSHETFRHTLETLQSLSHIPDTSQKFGQELTKHVHSLSQAICVELDDLLPAIQDAQSSTDVQGAAASKFSASTSDQVKLLRVLQALDYLSAPKNADESSDAKTPSILTLSYESLGLSKLWSKLSDCLDAVEEKGDTISFATILLPLIESLMVVCKHTTLKDAPVAVKEGTVQSPTTATDTSELEDLFFKFTSDHRKILNDIIRQTPKLMQGQFSILVKNSKVLDFDNKRSYFNKQIHSRHHAQRHPQPPLQLNVRRDQVFIDSYKALYFKNAEEMKYGKLNIRFNGEEGVDAGGVTREWFQVLARGMFDPNYALFQPVASDKTTFHPSPLSRVNDEHLLYFKFVGRIIGKALHEGRVLDCHFSRAVYKRILGKKPNLKDLESSDVDYYKSLVWILENDITDVLDEEFVVIEDEFGEEKIIDLIPDGRNISVTEENKKEYVQALVEYRLTESVKEQLDSFLGGFHDIIPAELISIFNEQELELLISGLPEIDVDDWKANTEYHNYNPSSQQIVWYWRIVKAMTNEERAKLLQFITGTSKVPLNGFKELEGVSGLTKCNIHKDPSTNRLPTSHTCFNQLDLPAYESFEVMKQNINTAISLGADYFGFA